ncbi:hypothetical protein I316_04895 [Kwoniella heveanensis BCC8398]|uniref:Uncharacterized protein n=1 Tax=Kwoniella heveanensis BCC8398 TaxID=1296120 RepID=A0A1B9GQY3_9TREE|nr:hypothetical protein I316_04895 [Kwoniella heveanensis BCC8398]
MGFMTSIREGSISLRRYTSRSSTATSPSRSRSQSSSADSSANVSRTTTPAPLTRQEKLSALLAQSLQTPSLPPPSAASGSSPSAGVEAQVAPVQTAAVDSDANAPKKYRDFLEQAKKR